jgi:hypothetical protein
MVDIVINEPLIKHVNEYDGIIIGTNCYQSMRNGFQFEASEKYPYIQEYNYKTRYGDKDKLGEIVECKKDNYPLFILAFITFGYNFKGNNIDFFDYDALAKSLKLINILYSRKSLATTMIGCSEFDGNADRERILSILNKYVTDFNLTLYDYKQESHKTIKQKEYLQKRKKEYEERKRKLKF